MFFYSINKINTNYLNYLKSTSFLQSQPYSFDMSCPSRISRQPLLQDPYEKYFCAVGPSFLARGRGGEGAFAVTDILEGTIVAFYNGVRQGETGFLTQCFGNQAV